MRRTMITVLAALALALCTAAVLPSGLADISRQPGISGQSGPTALKIDGQAPSPTTPTATAPTGTATTTQTATPTDTSSPAGPVDPGTGETGEAKQTRTDYAPLVIGLIALIVAVAALVLWRRRGKKTFV